MDFDELLDDFDDDDEVSEDRTLFKRELPNGQERTDFEVIERTVFGGAYPATTKEMRQKAPLACGHLVSKQNPVVGYCQGRRFGYTFTRRRCGRDYCEYCSALCERCSAAISASCCGRQWRRGFFCRSCLRWLRFKRSVQLLWRFALAPFTGEFDERTKTDDDKWLPESRTTADYPSWAGPDHATRHSSEEFTPRRDPKIGEPD